MKNIAGNDFLIITERKSSQFGSVGTRDKGSELNKLWTRKKGWIESYYDNTKRKDIYTTCLDKYVHDELARPIINAIVNATFSEPPDIQGDKDLVKRATEIIDDSQIDWSNWGVDLEVNGDMFIRGFVGDDAKIVSIPAESIDVSYTETNILDIKGYIQFIDTAKEKRIPPAQISHLKINNPSNTVYGNSTLRPVLWWLDVKDNLWERNWIRGGQYYGSPIIAICGVPSEHQGKVQASLEAEGQRPGKNWVFPEGVTVETLDFTKNYPIEQLVDRVYQYILAACGVPQHLIYETNSSRGVAMFSGDAFNMLIKSRQRTWELGIIKALRYILEDEGLWKDGKSKLRVRWSPVFLRDLKNFAAMMQMAVDSQLISKQTGREMIGVDHSEELERKKQEKIDEPEPKPEVLGLPNKMALAPKAAKGKPLPPARRPGANKRV